MEWVVLILFYLWIFALGKKSEQQFHLNLKLADLHTLSNLMEHAHCISDDGKRRSYLASVASLMRYGFEVQRDGFSNLERELLHCGELLNAYSIARGVEYRLKLAGEAVHGHRSVPGLSLICLLENALQHGCNQGDPAVINLEISMHRRKLCFAFSGYQLPDSATLERAPSGHGLHFLKQRLDYCYVKFNRTHDRQRLLVRNNQLQLNIPV